MYSVQVEQASLSHDLGPRGTKWRGDASHLLGDSPVSTICESMTVQLFSWWEATSTIGGR